MLHPYDDDQSEKFGMEDDEIGCSLDFIAVGGNRYPSSADWKRGVLAFGAGNNVALWEPDNYRHGGLRAVLAGHTDVVSAIRLVEYGGRLILISGSADKTIRIWTATGTPAIGFDPLAVLSEHQGTVNVISTLDSFGLFVSGAADASVKVWRLTGFGGELVQSISLKPRFIPLATAICDLGDGVVALAVAGTSAQIQIYARNESNAKFDLSATLSGHEGWIRSLDFVHTNGFHKGDILLASSSQDKFVRLWRLSTSAKSIESSSPGNLPLTSKRSLSNKTHLVGPSENRYELTFEALLIGHEDWIYTAKWAPSQDGKQRPTLLTASADNSLSMWQEDQNTGLWICTTRLGEISSQKGSTTATGSVGGFWVGLWHPEGTSVACLGRTGSWRKWVQDVAGGTWSQGVGITGHTEIVQDIAWATDGSCLFSTGLDQTTRIFAEWKREALITWHEMSRPQIHGYDLNCIDCISPTQFISGADEKLLRVFNKPKAVGSLMSKLSQSQSYDHDELPDAANIPVLGLSNKAVNTVDDNQSVNHASNGHEEDRDALDPASTMKTSTLDLESPPFEDHLARHTLWPEHEKLYGHGFEISAVAASCSGSIVATACKASSTEHAVIRLYDTRDWREIRPSLSAHSLTVTSLKFSSDDQYLLSVGRDRQWALYERTSDKPLKYVMRLSNPKGHSRMILDCSIANCAGPVFATAGRDKSVKLWRVEKEAYVLMVSLSAPSPVTSVAFNPGGATNALQLAYGCDDGQIFLAKFNTQDPQRVYIHEVARKYTPSKAVTALRWRPSQVNNNSLTQCENGSGVASVPAQLAASSDDFSIRLYLVRTTAVGSVLS